MAVQLRSLRSGDVESLTLVETGLNTGLFEGSVPMTVGPGQSGDHVLQTRNSGNPEYEPDRAQVLQLVPVDRNRIFYFGENGIGRLVRC